MKKIITFLVLLLAISSMTWALSFSSVAPSDLSSTPHTDVIGSGTTTSENFPSYSYYCYSLTQQIYYASEFNAISIGDTIVKIGFQLGAMPVNRYWKIYITSTDQSSLSNGFIPISPNDLVWSGATASMTANAWNEITFYSGIVFNGSNILVTFQDVTGSWQAGNQGIVTATGISGISRYIYRDNDGAFDPTAAVSGGTASAERLNMRFVSGSLNVNRDGDFIFSDRAKTHLIRYTGAGGNITIPSTVTSIGDGAFSGCSGLTSVTIPNSVTSIGNYAFYNCDGLASVTIPNSVTSIGDYAFYNCYRLTSVTIPNSVASIGNGAFYYCYNLISVTIGNSVATIGNYAFYSCYRLASVTIPNSVASIGNGAFYNCDGLTSISFGNSVTTIGNRAFHDCDYLTYVTIPNSVTSIGDSAFYDCDYLTSVTIDNSVATIGNSAFYNCNRLTSVSFGNSVTTIGNRAFNDCDGLTSITIPNTVTSIGDSAFYYCSRLASITIGNSVTTIGNYAFYRCPLTSVTIPNSVTTIGYRAFYSVKNVSYCGTATGAPWGARYAGCGDFIYSDSTMATLVGYLGAGGSITIPNTVVTIGDSVFYNCENLASVSIPNTVTSIGNSAFYDCDGLASVSIPNSVTSIGDYAFYDCDGLASVAIPNAVTTIGNYTFSNCSELTSVTIGNHVVTIGNYAFSYCPLTSVSIPNSVVTIGNGAFYECEGLTSITIPNSVTTIGNRAFGFCSNLASITIPNSVTTIGDEAFSDCSGLTSISIPNSVTTIGDYVFSGCRSLTSISIPNSVTSIGNYAFYYCIRLTSVTIPNSVTTIGDYAFYSGRLTSVTIGNSVTSIGNYAFNVSSLNSIFLGCTTPPQIQQTTFNASATHPVTFHIPCNTTETYRNAAIWNRAYYQYVEDMGCPTQVVVVANDTTLGTVTGGGTYLTGQTVTLTATAKPNCHFVAWQDGNSQNPRTITIDSSDTHLTFTAIFVIDTYFVVTVVSNDANMGTVSGGGRYLSGSTATLSASPMNDCRFVQWSDGNRSNPRTLRVTGNTTLMAIFRVKPDTVVVHDTSIIHDTTWLSYPVHDTTLIHDTTYIAVYDTTFVPVHDTTWLSYPVHDTTLIHDTTYIAVYDTTFVPVHDTTWLSYPVHDTTFVPVHDTTYIAVHDTTMVPYPVHDTTYIPYSVHDTTFITIRDTTWLPYPVHDTTYIAVHDTTWLPYPIHDTTYVPYAVYDTIVMHDTVGRRITYYELSVISGNNQRGVVAGSGRFPDSTMVEIAAIPIEGNRFLQWQDGNSDNPRTVHLLGANATFVATFEPSTQDIATPQSDDDVAITTHDGQITVSNVANRTVRLFDSVGRLLSTSNTPDHTRVFTLPTSGLYLLQVGTAPARRVVVVK